MLDQEEIFYIIQGTVTSETESGAVVVKAEEVIHFAPGEFQLGVNQDDERVIVLTLGAPRTSEEIKPPRLSSMWHTDNSDA